MLLYLRQISKCKPLILRSAASQGFGKLFDISSLCDDDSVFIFVQFVRRKWRQMINSELLSEFFFIPMVEWTSPRLMLALFYLSNYSHLSNHHPCSAISLLQSSCGVLTMWIHHACRKCFMNRCMCHIRAVTGR